MALRTKVWSSEHLPGPGEPDLVFSASRGGSWQRPQKRPGTMKYEGPAWVLPTCAISQVASRSLWFFSACLKRNNILLRFIVFKQADSALKKFIFTAGVWCHFSKMPGVLKPMAMWELSRRLGLAPRCSRCSPYSPRKLCQ